MGYADEEERTVASQAAASGPLPALADGKPDELVKRPMAPSKVSRTDVAIQQRSSSNRRWAPR